MVLFHLRADQSMILGDGTLVDDHLDFGTAVGIINCHYYFPSIHFVEVEHQGLKGWVEVLDGLRTAALKGTFCIELKEKKG